MEMSKREIVSSYKRATYKKRQIQILADLNGIGPPEIEIILMEAGELAGKKKPQKAVEEKKLPKGSRSTDKAAKRQQEYSLKEITEEACATSHRYKISKDGRQALYKRLDEIEAEMEKLSTEYRKIAILLEIKHEQEKAHEFRASRV